MRTDEVNCCLLLAFFTHTNYKSFDTLELFSATKLQIAIASLLVLRWRVDAINCTVCPYGEAPENQEVFTRISQVFSNITSCQALDDSPIFQALEGDNCITNQTQIGIDVCGCDPPPCPLCPSGEEPFAGNKTCERTQTGIYGSMLGVEAGIFGEPFDADEEVCDGLRIEKPALCGCSEVDDPCAIVSTIPSLLDTRRRIY